MNRPAGARRSVQEALLSPLQVTSLFGIPIGIVQIVLVFGLVIYFFYHRLQSAIVGMVDRLSLRWIVFLLIVVLGLVSSIISAILAAIILVEIVNALPMVKKAKVEIAVVSCFSIGLGAGLTPLGEPLSTIVVSKLTGAPYYPGSRSSSTGLVSLLSLPYSSLGLSVSSSLPEAIKAMRNSSAASSAKRSRRS